ncbi:MULTISPECIES: phosphatase PAP2 family protein [unclassified Capnocytophaga]|jgi:PAP2 superfamily.|uniref:phosphatase PAP2 family protein n=1 Tax=unclassified Capnocytophaga TaxID=2640652 RepID=UPI000202CBC9|nr:MULTISPECIES: phosphatase PAP2 family protein [unclassified Capnocytophaga]EGD34457.1 membrane-associated phospholipid phosphatase [Capnocytophaga sp. oral taxon 338 str. F0234]MEB3005292.1 phosphatase PAP2 family protein [Capnocytophaga sp. G2]
MLKDLLQKDYQLLVAINQTGTISWDTFWIAITNAWNWIPFFILILWINFYFFSKREAWRIFFYTLGILLLTIVITNTTKEIVARLRPLHTASLIPHLRIILQEKGYSFFSGHTSNSFAICTFLYLVFRKRIKVAFWVFLWPIPYAYSRMYLGVHFPTDIFIGILVGIATGTIGYWVYKKRQNTTLSP